MSLGTYTFICKSIGKDLEGYKPGKVAASQKKTGSEVIFYCCDFNHCEVSFIY